MKAHGLFWCVCVCFKLWKEEVDQQEHLSKAQWVTQSVRCQSVWFFLCQYVCIWMKLCVRHRQTVSCLLLLRQPEAAAQQSLDPGCYVMYWLQVRRQSVVAQTHSQTPWGHSRTSQYPDMAFVISEQTSDDVPHAVRLSQLSNGASVMSHHRHLTSGLQTQAQAFRFEL